MRRGGAFLASGADTCVYSPQIECAPGTQVPAEIPPGDYVSRVAADVGDAKDELSNQAEVKAAIHRIQQKYPGKDIETFFNVAVATCTPVFKDSDLLGLPRFKGDRPRPCAAINNVINTPGQKDDKINFITPRQSEDLIISKRPAEEVRMALRKLIHAVAYLNNEGVLHTDAHFANISWVGDRLILHDWGRALVGVEGFKKWVKRWAEGFDDMLEKRRRKRIIRGVTKVCQLVESCPVKLADDDTSHRFMKFYDVVSIVGKALSFKYLNEYYVDQFMMALQDLWHSKDVPTDQMIDHIHVLLPLLLLLLLLLLHPWFLLYRM